MASFNRNDYERLIRIARGLHDVTKGVRSGKILKKAVQNYAQEIFTMAEEVISQQVPPLAPWQPCSQCTDPMDCGSWMSCHNKGTIHDPLSR